MKNVMTLLLLPLLLFATDDADVWHEWNLISTLRTASIPYRTDTYDDPLSSYVLLIFLDTDHFYSDGTEGGLKLFETPQWRFTLMGKQHFIDMPRHDSHHFTDDTVDMGAALAWHPTPADTVEWQLLSDPGRRPRTDLRWRRRIDTPHWRVEPYAEAGLKSAEYNTYYYGLADTRTIKPDFELTGGLRTRYRLTDTILLYASAEVTWLGRETSHADTVRTPFTGELLAGAGLYRIPDAPVDTDWFDGFFRVAVGEATPSSFTENLTGGSARDLNRNYLISLFYGLPLSRSLFGTGIQTYFTPGFAHHFSSDVQRVTQEYVTAIKFFYKIPGWWLRVGAANGLSYIRDITYIERYINEKDGYDRTSHLMAHLDFSFDFELSHLFGEDLENLWFGYSLHHRSGIFESAHQYGNIKGGSNYNTLYLQYHLD